MCLDDATYFGLGPASHRVCPPGQCKEWWGDDDERGVTHLRCGWCGRERGDVIEECSCGKQRIRFNFEDGPKWFHLDDHHIPIPNSPACDQK